MKKPRRNPPSLLTTTKKMLMGYMEAALWSSTDDDENPLDDDFSPSDFSEGEVDKMAKDCADFLDANFEDVEEFMAVTGCHYPDIGHDFWLTRNGHGAGFWDRGAGAVGSRLTKAAKVYGSSDIYIGDDGELYVS